MYLHYVKAKAYTLIVFGLNQLMMPDNCKDIQSAQELAVAPLSPHDPAYPLT
jgi:hypothetical protein